MTDAKLTPEDLALRPGRGVRSPWLREALAAEGDPEPAPGPASDLDVDVAIVGGGYVGMWTAEQLTRRAPDLSIAILEQDICGGGPSGRNGGFVNAWWDELDTLVDLYGAERALEAAREAAASVPAIGAWCVENRVDGHFRQAGMLVVSTTPPHDERPTGAVEAAAKHGVPEALVALGAEQVQAVCRSPRFRNGAYMRDGATVQPALLARGLRRVLLERGVTIHEGTRVTRMRSRRGPAVRLSVESRDGTQEVRAPQVVLAVNAWAADWRPFHRSILAWGSYMVRSEPIPDRIANDLGWTGGESIYTARFNVEYMHVTRDGRVAIGSGGGLPGYGGRIGPSFTDDVDSARRAARAFRELFPILADVRLTDAWGGPIDVSPDHLPRFGSLPGGRVHYAVGFSGNGVAPSHLAGRVLAALTLGSDEPITRLPMVGPPRATLPPEPFRVVGARLMREAIVRREVIEMRGARPPWLLRQVTALPRRLGYHLGPDA
ncbi:MAG TPA: FAD-binding oxidoreductase [Candidatus Limnocylindria bacterium]|nr:FAD-binding oxidoreductase [Candidatus Limnocylindria bacterium]